MMAARSIAEAACSATPGRADRRPACPAAGPPPCLRRAALPPAMAATPAEPTFAAAPSRLHRRVCAVHRPCAVPPSRLLRAAAPCRLAVERATARHHGLRPRPPSGLPTSARTHARVRRRRSSLTAVAFWQRPASTAVARACGRRMWRRQQRLCSLSLLSNERSPPRQRHVFKTAATSAQNHRKRAQVPKLHGITTYGVYCARFCSWGLKLDKPKS